MSSSRALLEKPIPVKLNKTSAIPTGIPTIEYDYTAELSLTNATDVSSQTPSGYPTSAPTISPTMVPTFDPTGMPTIAPTMMPSALYAYAWTAAFESTESQSMIEIALVSSIAGFAATMCLLLICCRRFSEKVHEPESTPRDEISNDCSNSSTGTALLGNRERSSGHPRYFDTANSFPMLTGPILDPDQEQRDRSHFMDRLQHSASSYVLLSTPNDESHRKGRGGTYYQPQFQDV